MKGALAIVALAGSALAAVPASSQNDEFTARVEPVFAQVCSGCHNASLTSGGLDIAHYRSPASFAEAREGWERIVRKLRAGEMPPPGVTRPPEAQMAALLDYVVSELDEVDRNTPPDPGRVTARRLNRVEYQNTVRDLLGVDFRADEAFPPDDSGYGFDNIADILTVSPTLMEQYLNAAETIAARAVGGNTLPQPGFFSRPDRIRRIDANSVEISEILDYDAEYLVNVRLVGNRGDADPPVTLVISVDGTPADSFTVPVQISAVNRQGGATQRSSYETRVFLPSNSHTFRADFIDDPYIDTLDPADYRNNRRNIYPEAIEIAGPYPPRAPQPVEKKALVCDPDSGRACIDRIVARLASDAYRAPASEEEIVGLLEVYDEAASASYTPRESLQFAIAAMLVSPQFLFRIEADPEPGTTRPISDYELASRLSYFLWSSMPDGELFDLGSTHRLHEPEVLAAQVRRMIADPKSRAFSKNFVGQWLETRSLDALTRDADRFPAWDAELRGAMAMETELFFDAVLRENQPVSDFIDGSYTFLNERLAAHYGIEGVEGEAFRRVRLDGTERSGVFTQASVLTVTSYPTRTSVALRGKYLLENVLSAPPPAPPADVPALDEGAVGTALSLREQMEAHRTNPTCASCHSMMDPLGFALENYDATGRWRTRDGEFPIDASGVFPNGRAFDGPKAMKSLLLESLDDFTRGLAEKMLTYALGRGVESSYDRRVARDLADRTAANGYRIETLILGIVQSPPFLERSAAAEAE